MVIGDLESVEKIIPQQRPLGVTSWAAPADTAFWADSKSSMTTLLRKIDKPFGLFCFG